MLGLSLLVSGVFGFRASINADDEKTKTNEKWLFGIVGGGGLLMLLVGFASVYCEMNVIPKMKKAKMHSQLELIHSYSPPKKPLLPIFRNDD
mgnify:CR=1 FL=1